MSKMIKIGSCLKCNYFNGVQCMLLFNSGADYDDQKVSDSSKILPNCPLDDYPEINSKTLINELEETDIVIKTLHLRITKYEKTLIQIVTVNAMDYEYQSWAKSALAPPSLKKAEDKTQ